MSLKANTKPSIKLLMDYGLNTYEAKSYLSLLVKKHLTAVEVAKLSGIPRARIYETLENLIRKGLCRIIPSNVKKYAAINPAILKDKFNVKFQEIEKHIDEQKEELSKNKLEAQNLIEQLVPLFQKSRSNRDPVDYIDIIKDPLQVHRQVCELTANAEKEILVFTKPPFAVPRGDTMSQQTSAEEESLNRGVINKSIYQIPKDPEERKLVIQEVQWAIDAGEEARIVEYLPLKMAIFDEKIVVYFLEDPVLQKTSLTCMIIQHRSLAQVLKVAFETYWASASDISEYRLTD